MVAVSAERLPFQEAVEFISQKVRLPSDTWTDLKQSAHARAFVVAGAVKDDLVADFHQAVVRAIAEGRTKADFLKDFDTIVARHGWDYRGGRGWRSGVIYTTNMRMAFQAGRWAQVKALAGQLAKQGRKVYLRYSAILDGATRPLHQEWGTKGPGGQGIVLPWDHPFWATHYPPNDWGCRCTVEILTDDDLADLGLSVTPDAQIPSTKMQKRPVDTPFGKEFWEAPEGVGTGFAYNVGEAWLGGAVPRSLRHPLPAAAGTHGPAVAPPTAPPLHPVDPARLLPPGLEQDEYVDRFLAEFGATRAQPAPFRDVSGTRLAIGHELFIDRQAGGLKVDKWGRERYLLLLADALKDPDEIWVDWAETLRGPVLRRRYLRWLHLQPDGVGALSVFEWTGDGWWAGVTTFPPKRPGNMERQRSGALLWRRK